MSGFGLPQPKPSAGASWQALSGDMPLASRSHIPPANSSDNSDVSGLHNPQQQNEASWQYPYDDTRNELITPSKRTADVSEQLRVNTHNESGIVVPVEQLKNVNAPQFLAPTPVVRDPRQKTMAAVITFVSLLIALWGILGFLGSLSQTLGSVANGSQKLKIQMQDANKGLVSLDEKTSHLEQMDADSTQMKKLLTGIDNDMGSMLDGVNVIADGMTSMSSSLATLDGELGKVNSINSGMAAQLSQINAGLKGQVASVQSMRRDVEKTGQVVGTLNPRLVATNKRLAHVNDSVNIMGCKGISSNLNVKIYLGPIPNGSAKVYATVVPPSAWGTQADRKTPC